jgi:glycerate-2-kinase
MLDAGANQLTVADRTYDLGAFRRILVVGGQGGAAHRGGTGRPPGERITAGVLNVNRDQAAESIHRRIALFAADHPTPNETGAEGARQMLSLLEGPTPRPW